MAANRVQVILAHKLCIFLWHVCVFNTGMICEPKLLWLIFTALKQFQWFWFRSVNHHRVVFNEIVVFLIFHSSLSIFNSLINLKKKIKLNKMNRHYGSPTDVILERWTIMQHWRYDIIICNLCSHNLIIKFEESLSVEAICKY